MYFVRGRCTLSGVGGLIRGMRSLLGVDVLC